MHRHRTRQDQRAVQLELFEKEPSSAPRSTNGVFRGKVDFRRAKKAERVGLDLADFAARIGPADYAAHYRA